MDVTRKAECPIKNVRLSSNYEWCAYWWNIFRICVQFRIAANETFIDNGRHLKINAVEREKQNELSGQLKTGRLNKWMKFRTFFFSRLV